MNTAKEITEKKEIDQIIIEKAHLFDIRVQVEAAVVDAFKHTDEKHYRTGCNHKIRVTWGNHRAIAEG